jgi:hypothetical protein
LVRDEPIRVKVNCRNPGAINCIIEVFLTKLAMTSNLWLKATLGKPGIQGRTP